MCRLDVAARYFTTPWCPSTWLVSLSIGFVNAVPCNFVHEIIRAVRDYKNVLNAQNTLICG